MKENLKSAKRPVSSISFAVLIGENNILYIFVSSRMTLWSSLFQPRLLLFFFFFRPHTEILVSDILHGYLCCAKPYYYHGCWTKRGRFRKFQPLTFNRSFFFFFWI